MKLPAIAIAAFFAAGIAFGLMPAVAQRAGSHTFLAFLFAASVTSLLVGILLTYFGRLVPGGVVSLLCWGLLGLTGACIVDQPRAADAILSRVEAGTVGLGTPLRYYGQLRDEPEKLPWGVGYDIQLSGVDYEGAFMPATGGLRLSYATHAGGPAPIELHAGDSVSVLTQAKLPQVFRDEGAFDRRAYLEQQGIDLVATLRAPELLEITKPARPGIAGWASRARRALGDEIDAIWATQPRVAGVLRAMLLGDRSFVERDEATDFQKTGAFHVLVVAGLHVGAFAVALFWIGRRLRLPRVWTAGLTLLMLLAYVSVVEQRAPVLRAGLMAAIVVMGGFFFRRLDLLNSAAVAALVLLIARPLALRDASFQLSFLAIGCIAGLAIPWLESTVQPYARALRGWRDVTRDAGRDFHDARDAGRECPGADISRVGIAGADAGVAARDASAARRRISPHYAVGSVGEFCGGAADGVDRSGRIFDFNRRGIVSSVAQFACDAVVVAYAGTATCCRMVRAY